MRISINMVSYHDCQTSPLVRSLPSSLMAGLSLFCDKQCLAPALVAPAPYTAALCSTVVTCSNEPDGRSPNKKQRENKRSRRS